MITYQGDKLQTIRSAYTIGNHIKEAFQHTINGEENLSLNNN